MMPGLRAQWTGAWFEPSCADIEVAAFHAACLAAIRAAAARCGPMPRCSRRGVGRGLATSKPRRAEIEAGVIGQCRRRLGRRGRRARRRRPDRARSRGAGPWSSSASGATGLRDLPLVTDLHQSFYFKGEGDNSVWVSPLDETPVDPCDAAPEEIDVAIAIDRFEQAVDWPVEAVERKWAGLRTFAPDRG